MKNILLVFIILLTISSCNSIKKINNEIRVDKVKSAYKYLNQNINGRIVVSDTIINLSITNFSLDISKSKKVMHSKVYDSLIQEEDKYEQFEYPIKNLLQNKNIDGDYRVYFSRPTKNHIVMEVFDIKKWKETAYNKEVFFGESEIHLLIFDENDIIEEYRNTLSYN
ncbi:hypothetical protein OAC88_00495 [Flavobacteriaceae bacterium]|nr:hypothetical protein [Flavobacteriaceae bacterium]